MGDQIIITDDEPKPAKPAEVIVVTPEPRTEKVITEKTTVTETKVD
jgi:hypothetical protein